MSRRRSTPPAPSARDDDPTRPGWDLSDVDEVDYHGAAYRWSADVDHEMVGDVLDQRAVDSLMARIDAERVRLLNEETSSLEEEERRVLRLMELRRKRENLLVEATHSGLRAGHAEPVGRIRHAPIAAPTGHREDTWDLCDLDKDEDEDEDVDDHPTIVPGVRPGNTYPRWTDPDASEVETVPSVKPGDIPVHRSVSAPTATQPPQPSAASEGCGGPLGPLGPLGLLAFGRRPKRQK